MRARADEVGRWLVPTASASALAEVMVVFMMSAVSMAASAPAPAQAPTPSAAPAAGAQPQDEEYTRLIREYLTDKRITTELVDHMPASATVPSPLKFLRRIPGKPGELTYAADIERYYRELARTSPRVRLLTLGTTEEGA